MKQVIRLTISAICVCWYLSACNNISSSFNDTLHGKPKMSADERFFASAGNHNTTNLVTDKATLQKAESTLRNLPEFKGKSIKVFNDLYVYGDGRIMLDIQDPDTLQNVNEYEYETNASKWTSKPVTITAGDINSINNSTISLDSIRFTNVPAIAAIFAQKAKSVDSESKLTDIYYIPSSKQWYCDDIKTTRANYTIYFNTNGTVKSFTRQ